MKTSLRLACLCASIGVIGSTRTAMALDVTGGDVPLPASQNADGTLTVSWDGAYSDLLAADALAECWTTQPDRGLFLVFGEQDSYIATLLAEMNTAVCPTATCSDSTLTSTWEDKALCTWMNSRETDTCNVDAATGDPRALDVSALADRASQTAAYVIPSASSLGLSGGTWSVPFGPTGSAADFARGLAQRELAYGELSLCMAEQLNEKLDTVQVAFASGDDLARVQEAVRERALTAVYQFSVLTKTFATPQPAPTTVNSPAYYLAPMALWAQQSFPPGGSATTKQFGDDFAAAVELLVKATDASIQITLRDPSAQDVFGTPTWDASGNFTGVSGPREDVLGKILYDGYEFASPTDSRAPVSMSRRAILADMSAPTVGVMLGLARQAKALSLAVNGTSIPRGTNALNLHLAVENFTRNAVCQAKGVPTGSCAQADASTAPTDYATWQRYRVTRSDAQVVVDALTEALFGPPTPASHDTDTWQYPVSVFTSLNPGPTGPAQQLTLHLFGKQSFAGDTGTGVGTITIDPDFTVAPPSAVDIQSMRGPIQLPVRDINPAGNARDQIGWFDYNPLTGPGIGGYPTGQRQLGSNSVLAIAREALLQAGQSQNASVGIYTEAAPALPLIQNAIGSRQVLLRQDLTATSDPGSCPSCVTYSPTLTTFSVFGIGGDTYTVNADVIAQSGDPATQICIENMVPLAATIARDPNTTTIWGGSQAASLTSFSPLQVSTLPSNYELRSGSGQWNALFNVVGGESVFLQDGSGASATYDHVYSGFPAYGSQPLAGLGVYGSAVTFGGRFAREIEDAWKFETSQWSSPENDGFDLPLNWTPAADASLLGDSSASSVEQAFVQRATTAASDSTSALQQAFDTLQQNATDSAALLASDTKSAQLTALDYQSLCGAAQTCSPQYTPTSVVVPACPAPDSADCEAFRGMVNKILGNPANGSGPGVPLATAVTAAFADPSPTFSTYSGGTIQSLFLNQWNAWNALNASLTSAVANAQSAAAQVVSANADLSAAQSDYTVASNAVVSAFAQILAQGGNWNAQITQYNANKQQYDAQRDAASQTVTQECGGTAVNLAKEAGWSYSGKDTDLTVNGDGSTGFHIFSINGESWSPAASYAQADRCNAANNAEQEAITETNAQKSAMSALITAAQGELAALNIQIAGLPAQFAAAQAHYEAAIQREATAPAAQMAQMDSSLQAVQAAYGQLLASVTAIDQAYTSANIDASKVLLDQQEQDYDVRARFGVRQRYASYDLWRARALTENARRLALAARRAIEARYVVNLSALSAPEPFVDSPSQWANDVYASDLKPPFAVGLTPSPTSGTGIYPNAVADYVNNLTLFLDGYSVQRPTAAVQSDTEVIQLPGPASQVSTSAFGTNASYIDPASSGWTFYCSNTQTWISDPNLVSFTTATASWTLATACNGQPPTLARYDFVLDPWGRLDGAIGDPPPTTHYNVRSGAVALNLVGSGIRDCANASDPSTCYAEPFIRYDLEQVGPAWVTDYNQAWKSLDIPVVTIEGAKALAEEEWLDPVTNGFNRADVTNVARTELRDRPIGGQYELTLELTPDVVVERIQRIQLLTQTSYWVREDAGGTPPPPPPVASTSTSSTFTPQSIPNLRLWLASDIGLTRHEANVIRWADQSGIGNDFVASGSGIPYTPSDSRFNGLPSLGGAGNADALVGPSPVAMVDPGITGAEWFLVIQSDNTTNGAFGPGFGVQTTQYFMLNSSIYDDFFGSQTSGPDTRFNWGPGAAAQSPMIYNSHSTEGSWSANINGVSSFTSPQNHFTVGSGATGLFGAGTSYDGAVVAAVLLYERVLTADERTQVNHYLGARYGIVVP